MAETLFETVSCPLCGSSSYDVFRPASYPPEFGYQHVRSLYSALSEDKLFDAVVRCRDCSLLYLNPRVKREIIIESYSTATESTTNLTFVRQQEYRIDTFRRSLKRLVRKYGLKPDRSKYVLDIGCAAGAFPKAAYDLGFSVVGVEPNELAAERARQTFGFDIRTGLLEDQDFGGRKFDLISLWDVIEHLTNPRETTDVIHALLKDDGLLVINFPNHDSLARKILGRKWPMYVNVHVTYFTPATMAKLLDGSGFEVVAVRPYFQTLELGYAVKRAGAYFRVFAWIEGLVAGTAIYHAPLTYNIGQSLLVARKKTPTA
jgi:2-polyprenyl-3-methyl-5-hydroxy-6-metoxy-1,4-benzoquinol methylase